jgi:hypothetical protein
VTTYTNLFPNPRPNPASSLGWGKADGASGVSTASTITGAAGPGGDSARRTTVNTAPTNFGLNLFGGNSSGIIPATAGNAYSATAYVRCSKNQVVTARIIYYTTTAYAAQVSSVDGPPIAIPANTWTEVKYEGDIAPATAAAARIVIGAVTGGTPWVAGDTLDVQAATIVQNTVVPQPFHGGMTSDASHTYAWTGTADASTSTLIVPAIIAGVTATATGGAPAGTVSGAANAAGVTPTATATARAGAVTVSPLVVGATATAAGSAPPAPDWILTDPWNPADPWPGPHAIIGATATATAAAPAGTPRIIIIGATATATASATIGTPGVIATVGGVTAGATAASPPGTPRAAAVVGGAAASAAAFAAAGNVGAGRVIAGATATATATAGTPGAFFSVAAIHTIGLATLTSSGLSVAILTGNGLSVAVLHTTD